MEEMNGRKKNRFLFEKEKMKEGKSESEGIGNVGDGREQREGDDPWWRRVLEGERDEGRKKERKIYGAARCRLTTGSVRLPTKPLLHAISSTILPRVAPFAPPLLGTSSSSFPSAPPSAALVRLARFAAMHRCIRSLHNYYSYHE